MTLRTQQAQIKFKFDFDDEDIDFDFFQIKQLQIFEYLASL